MQLQDESSYLEIKEDVLSCLKTNQVPLILGSFGIGKSSLAREIAEEYDLYLIDCRVTSMLVEDFQGLPTKNGDVASYLPFDTFPTASTPIPEGYKGWLLFLDELTLADNDIQKPMYKLILDRAIGNHTLHENVFMMAASNREEDSILVNSISMGIKTRLTTLHMKADTEQWLNTYAYKNRIDSRIITFINMMPSELNNYKAGDDTKITCAIPRTWEKLSHLIKNIPTEELLKRRNLIRGTVGDSACSNFLAFINSFDEITEYKHIIADPEKARIPDKKSARFANVSIAANNLESSKKQKEELDLCTQYFKRYDPELFIMFLRIISELRIPLSKLVLDELDKVIKLGHRS